MVSVMFYPCMFCMSDSVYELFCETIRNMFGCGCYFVVEYYGVVKCGWRYSVGYTTYSLPKSVCVCCTCDPSVHLDAPSICFVCVFVCRKLSPHLRV